VSQCGWRPKRRRGLPGMLLTEFGLQFAKESDRSRCVEWPDLTMLRSSRYEVDGQGLDTLAGAVRFLKGERQHRPIEAPSRPVRQGIPADAAK